MSISIKVDPRTSQVTASCLVCKVAVQLNEITSHRSSAEHVATAGAQSPGGGALEMWRCNVCGITMNAKSKDSHINGRKHRGRAKLLAFWDETGTHGMVSIESLAASPETQDEQLELHLHNIDTQWGLFPDGGAYDWDSD
ncbi:hypothetical protein Moror_7057 [Moniliophthora roreri MCA 2997]|uniref:C2H2-type domain-containing protein n=2 Tax=Moniliophthora roreri TaxID=221103 RepID=V2XTU3_MONRO|nr:hypothetical protein Moror_7057 [Moniliophthora roreri MCA 2997]KAI3608427.1 hypothetical protein WG66_000954 [Moniliophthora roreri]